MVDLQIGEVTGTPNDFWCALMGLFADSAASGLYRVLDRTSGAYWIGAHLHS